jgi:hypothetical protein
MKQHPLVGKQERVKCDGCAYEIVLEHWPIPSAGNQQVRGVVIDLRTGKTVTNCPRCNADFRPGLQIFQDHADRLARG